MVEPGFLIVGVGVTLGSVWAMMNPHKDFTIGKKINPEFWGVDNKDELELSETGVLRNMIGYGLAGITGLFLIMHSL